MKKVEKPAVPKPTASLKVVRVGLLGLGTVGSGVAEILTRHRALIAARAGVDIKIVRAAVRNTKKKRKGPANKVPLTGNPKEILEASDVDIVAEVMGGVGRARQYLLNAFAAGKPVVTANKAVLAAHGPELFKAARKHSTDIYFEAAVAGGIPIIRALREGLASDRVTSITGILNGTTNYILGQMEQGADYAAALKQAQGLGYAEADPSLDVGGQDARDKLVILMHLAYGRAVKPEDLFCDGITSLRPEVLIDAERLGYRVKLLGVARRIAGAKKGDERIDARVHPCFVPKGHVLSNVPDAQNAVAIESDSLGTTLYQGPGAGGLPTGSAVVSNLIEAARDLKAGISGRVLTQSTGPAPRVLPAAKAASPYYLRVEVSDEPGVLAAVTNILGRQKVSLATVIQQQRAPKAKGPVGITIITHASQHGAMARAMKALAKNAALHRAPDVVRMEGHATG